MINNNSGNKNKMLRFTGQYIFFLILIQVNLYFLLTFFYHFLSLIRVNVYFVNTNTGQCTFLLTFFIINAGQCIFFIDLFYH